MRRTQSYIPTLDGWRASAIALVIGAHSVPALKNSRTWLGARLASLFSHNAYGVDVFFALSGFLICTLLLEEKAQFGTISLRRFYFRRAFRILPIILAYLGVVFILSKTVLPMVHGRELFAVLFFVRNYVGGSWYTGHFWSLAIEEHFYLFVPVLLLLLKWRPAVLVCTGLAVGSIVTRALEYHANLFPGTMLQYRTENRLDGLMWGAVIALLFHRAEIRAWMESKFSWITVAGVGIIGTIGVAVFTSQPSRRTIVALVAPILIAHTVLNPRMGLSRVLETGAVRWIGRLSYSIYVWQMIFLARDARPLGMFQNFPLALFMALGCAVMSYYAIEKPMIRLGHRLAARMTSRPSVRSDTTHTLAHQ